MAEPLEPGILESLAKAGDMALSVQKLADLQVARGCHVSKVCSRLAREGKIFRTKDEDEDGFGPYYRISMSQRSLPASTAATTNPDELMIVAPPKTEPKPERMEDRVATMVDRIEQLVVENRCSLEYISSRETPCGDGIGVRRRMEVIIVSSKHEA